MYDLIHSQSHSHTKSIPNDWQARLSLAANYIRDAQLECGAIPWFSNGKLDPWDHVEAAMGLSIQGFSHEAERAYLWLAEVQRADGSWHSQFNAGNSYCGHTDDEDLRETNFIAYMATGVWHHFLITNNLSFLREMFPSVRASIDFVLNHQSAHGEIAWAVDSAGESENDALLTACSSILRSIDCAEAIASRLGLMQTHWHEAKRKLADAIRHKPERFDRTWESKSRFSMDWYYPILSGAYAQTESQTILTNRWSEFAVDELGCRCVNDEPWVTMAETSELVIALTASGNYREARKLFNTLAQWQDHDGGFWTGYVFRDQAIWPEEKTTWTAGAVILAADALFELSPASAIFTQALRIEQTEAVAQ